MANRNTVHCSYYSLALCALLLFHSSESRGESADSVVVFNEIHYHPADETPEWIELHNLMGVTVDLSGWRFEGAGTLTFAEGTRIPGRGFLLLAAQPEHPRLRGLPVYPEALTGRLSNQGETLQLFNPSDRVMDQVRYRGSGDWPVGTAGSGATLAKRDETSAESGPQNWTASPQLGGTPGVRNTPIGPILPKVLALVEPNQEWHYFNTGRPAPPTWTEPEFDPTTWPSGRGVFRAGTTPNDPQPLPLFAYWKLDEESGMIATEVVSGRTGRLHPGAEWILDAERGTVIEFDGIDGYVDTGITIPQMTLENDFTWAFWGFSRKAANVNVIVGNRHRANGADFSPREFIKFTNGGLEFHRLGSGEDILYPAIPRNEWVHHALVKQGRNLTYYRNGAPLGSQQLSAGLNNPQPLFFGGDQTRENWRGRLDDVALWNAALETAAIAGLADGTYTPETVPASSANPGAQAGTELPGVSATAYFRTTFTFEDSLSRTKLVMNLLADDGAAVYLNGHEVHRSNLPSDTVSFETLAIQAIGKAPISDPIEVPTEHLRIGRNVLTVEVHQASTSLANEDIEFGLNLVCLESPDSPSARPRIRFSEISPETASPFRIELANGGTNGVPLTDYLIQSSNGRRHRLTGNVRLEPGGFIVLSDEDMNMDPNRGDRLFLLTPDGTQLIDAAEVRDQHQARNSGEDPEWYLPPEPSFGTENPALKPSTVVINEIMYHPMAAAPNAAAAGQWLELLNYGDMAVDLSDWRFVDGIQFAFPSGTILGAKEFLLLVANRTQFETIYPNLNVIGEWSGSLSRRGERLRLVDAMGNTRDEVTYYDGGRWPSRPDGGGSSLELQDPRADNRKPAAWAASRTEGEWQSISYRGRGISPGSDPTRYQEFILGLLSAGECLIDDISVVENPDGGRRELIQNGDFESGQARFWRFLGNHRHATVVADPDQPGNHALHLRATGPTEHMSNHLETTLRNNGSYIRVSEDRDYEISFRVKWLGGSNQLNTRLYFNRLARITPLTPLHASGTPGQPNSKRLNNIGPTLTRLTHSPAVPEPNEPIQVRIHASDPDEITSLTLHYSASDNRFSEVAMEPAESEWTATIPGQPFGTTVQFYVTGNDTAGAQSVYPTQGEASAALIPIADGQADLDLGDCHPMNLRIVMKRADIDLLHAAHNVMSNERLGCTVIVDEREIYYDAGVRLKGSEHGRASDLRVSYNLRFPVDQPFRGAHETIAIDRSGAGEQFSQREIVIKHAINHAGGIPGSYDDLIRVIAPRPQHTGSAMLSKSRFDREFLAHQFENGDSGSKYEYELVYVLSSTTGGVEGLKVTQPSEVHGVGVRPLGSNDKERYRWHWLLKNQRSEDNFDPIIRMVSVFGQSGERFRRETEERLDVNQWLRAFAIQVLFGIADNYASGSRHNALFYQRPADGRMLYFPWDMDFTFVRGAQSSLTPNDELDRLIAASGRNRRDYYRHLWEIIQTTFNPDYLSEWTQHYSCFLPHEDLTRFNSYIRQRSQFASAEIRRTLPPEPFQIAASNPPTTSNTSISISGNGWLDVAAVRLDTGVNLPLVWTEWNRWMATVPIRPGSNQINLEAVDRWGQSIGLDSINITGTGRVFPATQANVAISELMYHPAEPSESELVAGWDSAESFEYIELVNLAPEFTIDLGGTRFTDGIRLVLPNTLVPPGGRALLVGNRAAFQARYGRALPIIGEYQIEGTNRLSNGGERLHYKDANGATIASLEWSDAHPWPSEADGRGHSMILMRPGTDSPTAPESWRSSVDAGGNPGSSDQTHLSTWLTEFGIEDEQNDGDQDGWTEAWEYLAGTHPGLIEEQPTLQVHADFEANVFILEILSQPGQDDIQLRPRLSLDLNQWSDDGLSYQGRTRTDDGSDWIRYHSLTPLTEVSQQYIRLDLN